MRNRIIIAFLILGVFLPIVYLSLSAFQILVYIIIVLGTKEVLDINRKKHYHPISKIIIIILNLIPAILMPDPTKIGIIYIGIIMLIYFSIMVFDKKMHFDDISYLFTFNLYIMIAAICALYLREQSNGFYLLVYVVIVTAASDSGAYFVGSFFGKHKLIPSISPKKTIEGAIGGLVIACIVGVIYSLILPTGLPNIGIVAVVSLVLAFFGQMGDLFFSSIKRTYNIKDFSNLLKEHGGILDRVDSHLTNIILYVIIITQFIK